jgi:hypothetical protein
MKKLLLAMGCISAAVAMSSCTADGLDTEQENSKHYNQITVSATDEPIPVPPLIDDKDKTKG